jgi:hypothetical protein
MSSTIMIVVYSIEVSTLYLCIVISLLAKRIENLLFTTPLVYNPEITICRYKGLLHEYVMLYYGFPYPGPACSAKFSLTRAPLAPCGSQAKHCADPHATEQDTLPITSLISKQVISYLRCDGTGCFGGSTPKNRFLLDSSKTNHIP